MSSTDLHNQKWQKLLRRAWLFRLVPFVDFVFVAGSMAMGNPREDSDFDVIVGCRQGRIFTARFSCWFIFSLFGWYAIHEKNSHHSHELVVSHCVKDKFCFSHFITPASYRLSLPYNEYWKKLYQSLVPVFGDPVKIQEFYDANSDWLNSQSESPDPAKRDLGIGPVRNSPPKGSFDPRYGGAGAVSNGINRKFWVTKVKEWAWGGRFGDPIEKFLKKIQIRKIEKSLKITETYNPRIIYNDNELEFHPHTKRIEDFIKNLK